MNFLMPDESTITSIFSVLFGDETTVKTATKADQATDWIATYVGSDGSTVAACICNKEFVIYAGGSLIMIPPAVAKKSAVAGNACEATTGSFHEIMNIGSRLMLSDNTPHLKLAKVLRRGEMTDLQEFEKAATRKDFEIDIPRYGAGRIACLVT